MIVAQITDPHISLPGALLFGGYDPAAALSAVIARVNRLRPLPDFVIFTGDLTETGTSQEYESFLNNIKYLHIPCAAIPGNHDRRDTFQKILRPSRVQIGADPSWLHLVIEGFPLRLIGLDTLGLEGDPGGQLDTQRLNWLTRRLAETPDHPTLLFSHHPPFATGIAGMDAWGLADPDRLAAILTPNHSVLRLCCGHVHRAVETTWAGKPAGICPSVAWAMPLLDPGTPALIRQAPGFQLHRWTPETGLVTHTEFLDTL